MIERDYWHTVLQLESEWVHWVIDDNEVFESSITEDPQVFNVIAVWGPQAGVSVQAKAEELPCGINIVQDCIGIGLMWSCEDSYLKEFVGFLQTLIEEWSQVKTGLKI